MDKQKEALTNGCYTSPPPYVSHRSDIMMHDCEHYGVYTLDGSNVIINTRLEKFAAITNCSTCQVPVQTNVEKWVNSEGTIWAILCCCFGSPLLAFLVWFIDCFNEWIHHCPRCNKILAKYKPEATFQTICLLACLTFGVVILLMFMVGFYFYYYAEMQARLDHLSPTSIT